MVCETEILRRWVKDEKEERRTGASAMEEGGRKETREKKGIDTVWKARENLAGNKAVIARGRAGGQRRARGARGRAGRRAGGQAGRRAGERASDLVMHELQEAPRLLLMHSCVDACLSLQPRARAGDGCPLL